MVSTPAVERLFDRRAAGGVRGDGEPQAMRLRADRRHLREGHLRHIRRGRVEHGADVAVDLDEVDVALGHLAHRPPELVRRVADADAAGDGHVVGEIAAIHVAAGDAQPLSADDEPRSLQSARGDRVAHRDVGEQWRVQVAQGRVASAQAGERVCVTAHRQVRRRLERVAQYRRRLARTTVVGDVDVDVDEPRQHGPAPRPDDLGERISWGAGGWPSVANAPVVDDDCRIRHRRRAVADHHLIRLDHELHG